MAAETEKAAPPEAQSPTHASDKWMRGMFDNLKSGTRRLAITGASAVTEAIGLIGLYTNNPLTYLAAGTIAAFNPINLLMFAALPLAASAFIAHEGGLKSKSIAEKTHAGFWRGANMAMSAVPIWGSLATRVIGFGMSTLTTLAGTRGNKK